MMTTKNTALAEVGARRALQSMNLRQFFGDVALAEILSFQYGCEGQSHPLKLNPCRRYLVQLNPSVYEDGAPAAAGPRPTLMASLIDPTESQRLRWCPLLQDVPSCGTLLRLPFAVQGLQLIVPHGAWDIIVLRDQTTA